MKTIYAFYAANRYWPHRERLNQAFQSLCHRLNCADNGFLITDECPETLPEADTIVIIPMSGAVQKRILNAAFRYHTAILYGAYISGNVSEDISQDMMRANAAPTLMDTWAVLRRTNPRVALALNEAELNEKLRLMAACCHVHGATVLKIGETEPWVVSTASDIKAYEKRFGVSVVSVPQEELEKGYLAATREQAAPYYHWFTANAKGCMEPSDEDLWNASRMAFALITLMERYGAKAAALACFNLLRTGTTACLGVSYINNSTDMCVSCEGDADSAITMLLMKKLTDYPLWMANPGIHPDGTINFNHCTSPTGCTGCTGCTSDYILRSHHESGIGVSLQVEMPADHTITACRISNEAADMTIHRGTSLSGKYETACRTQMYVRFDDMDHYLDTALGCHQVFAFEDIAKRLQEAARIFGLRVL